MVLAPLGLVTLLFLEGHGHATSSARKDVELQSNVVNKDQRCGHIDLPFARIHFYTAVSKMGLGLGIESGQGVHTHRKSKKINES